MMTNKLEFKHVSSLARGFHTYLLVGVGCFSSIILQVITNDLDECSPRCWDAVQQNSGVLGATYQGSLIDVEECKTLCINNGTCIGLDWSNNECWFQLRPLPLLNRSNVNHWSLANCTGDCAPYCWKAVQIGFQVEGITQKHSVADENRCKLLCSKRQSCTGVDWNSSCYLIFNDETPKNKSGIRHWGIKRNLPTICPDHFTYTTTVRVVSGSSSTVNQKTLSNNTSPTDSIASNSMSSPLSSTKSLEERTTESSSYLKTGIIVLATLFGLCILIIIGVVINTIKMGRRLHLEIDKNTRMDDNYEDVQSPNTTEGSEYVNNMDFGQINPSESVYELI